MEQRSEEERQDRGTLEVIFEPVAEVIGFLMDFEIKTKKGTEVVGTTAAIIYVILGVGAILASMICLGGLLGSLSP